MIRPFGNPIGVTYHHGAGLIDILAPEPRHFSPGVVARALAGKYRWCGTARKAGGQITVAQHCCAVHDALRELGHGSHTCLWGLLHELDEVFLPDIPTPLKRAGLVDDWKGLAERHMRVGAKAFGLTYPMPGVVHDYDRACAVAEFNAITGQSDDGPTSFCDHDFTDPWGPASAEIEFMQRLTSVLL